MKDPDTTDPEHPVPTDLAGEIVSGETVPPDEHTLRVRALENERRLGPKTIHTIHDDTEPESASVEDALGAARKRRRRERDRKAEARVVQVLIGVVCVAAVIGWYVVNRVLAEPELEDPSLRVPKPAPPLGSPASAAHFPDPRASAPHEPVVIPALLQLESSGLTIAAEGLPEVVTEADGPHVARLAAFETCRFAWAVWEFSPNKRFRFLPTCAALGDRVMVGAYEVHGAEIRMSALVATDGTIVSSLRVEKPSSLVSKVTLEQHGSLEFTVNQRVTVMHEGLEGEAFRDTYRARNTLEVPGATPPRPVPVPAAPAPSDVERDPILQILRENER